MKPFNSFVEWAKANAHPVSSASEDNAEELSFLKSALADARVVSLGEFQHYTGVFNAFHFKLFRYLVENLGFTAFAFETPFADAALAYRYVVGEDIPEDKVFCYGMSPMFGGWKETQDLLRWMREYNLSNKGEKPLHFYGVDIGSAAYGGNREARLGQRSDFSRPRQGVAEKSASATRKARRHTSRRFASRRAKTAAARKAPCGGCSHFVESSGKITSRTRQCTRSRTLSAAS